MVASPAGGPSPEFYVCGLSRAGRRPANEDSAGWAAYGPESRVRAFAVVCDGMGGYNAGEVASLMALRSMQDRIGQFAAAGPASNGAAVEGLEPVIARWVLDINGAILARGTASASQRGMGTTLAAAFVVGQSRLVVANVGDSKVFLVRGLTVTQLSVDHTAMAEQRRSSGRGPATREEEAANPFAHALTRSIGQEETVAPDVRLDLDLAPGDLVVVTSDGVTDRLDMEGFLSAVEASASLEEVAETIYRKSFEAGSDDNITVVLLGWGFPGRLGAGRLRDRTQADGEDHPLDATVRMERPAAVVPVPVPVVKGETVAEQSPLPAVPTGKPNGLVPVAKFLVLGIVIGAALFLALPKHRSEAPKAPTPSPVPSVVVVAPPPDPGKSEEDRPAPEILRVVEVRPAAGAGPVRKPIEALNGGSQKPPTPADPTPVPPTRIPEPPPADPEPPPEPRATPRPRTIPAVSVRSAELKGVEVFVLSNGNLRFVFRFDRPVTVPSEKDETATLIPTSIKAGSGGRKGKQIGNDQVGNANYPVGKFRSSSPGQIEGVLGRQFVVEKLEVGTSLEVILPSRTFSVELHQER